MWNSCLERRIVKREQPDIALVKSLRELAIRRETAYNILPMEHTETRVTLLYDVLRLLLEAVTIEHGFRIYNHECYAAFLQHIGLAQLALAFDRARIIRNDINYYGMSLSIAEAAKHCAHMHTIHDELLKL